MHLLSIWIFVLLKKKNLFLKISNNIKFCRYAVFFCFSYCLGILIIYNYIQNLFRVQKQFHKSSWCTVCLCTLSGEQKGGNSEPPCSTLLPVGGSYCRVPISLFGKSRVYLDKIRFGRGGVIRGHVKNAIKIAAHTCRKL